MNELNCDVDVTRVHCLKQLTAYPFPLSSGNGLIEDEIIHFFFLLFSLLSNILNSLVYCTDMKGVGLVEYC